jgi:sugar phosphate isomerase/epimerase
MRYYTDPGFKLGAFTHPDETVRRAAIDITKRGLDSLARAGGSLMTLWMGQDGFDYSFQVDYGRIWDQTIAAIREVADHNSAIDISIEYKPNEPRSFSLMPDAATTLLAIKEIDRPNLGVTLDFAHVLYADEMPAHAASLVARHSRLLGIHLNDGYGKRDDGLMAGSVHPIQTIELLYELDRIGYDGAIYFDTFLSKNFAIVGSTRTGKSTSTALILHRITEKASEGHVVMIDPHGEYAKAFEDTGMVFNVDNLELPYWLLNLEEHCEVLLTSEGAARHIDRDILARCLQMARAKSVYAQGLAAVTTDTPIPYLLSVLVDTLQSELAGWTKIRMPPIICGSGASWIR